MPGKKLTEEVRHELSRVIDQLGGISHAASILDVTGNSLGRYLRGEADFIAPKTWDKLKKYLFVDQAVFYGNLAAAIRHLRGSEQECRKKYWCLLSEQTRHAAEKASDKDLAAAMAENPFAFLECAASPYRFESSSIGGLKETVAQIKEDSTLSPFKLHRRMIEFAQVYNAFRPHTIDRYHPYHGTVEMMDGIFETLFGYLRIRPDIRFSKWPSSTLARYMPLNTIDHGDVDWGRLLADIDSLQESIEEAMARTAFDMFLQFGSGVLAGIAIDYAKKHVRYLDQSISGSEIGFDEAGSHIIVIRGERVEIRKGYQLNDFLHRGRKP